MLKPINGNDGIPPEPDWTALYHDELDLKLASDFWRMIVSEMKEAQTLCVANGPAIKRLVVFQVEFERQARAVGEDGVIHPTMKIKVPQIHPSWTVLKQAAELASTMEAELGLSPRRRNVVKVQKKTKRTTAADEFLKPVAVRPGN
ncbi:P27 family phage terminase small subunit [Bradyrhizobium sp. DASA03076]|uniref:P27 family phage terminase small subunit n=1 Tax=Bradyrhizobium sp. BLXBL-03 TaxID=3395916 RepID=UPI003F7258BE